MTTLRPAASGRGGRAPLARVVFHDAPVGYVVPDPHTFVLAPLPARLRVALHRHARGAYEIIGENASRQEELWRVVEYVHSAPRGGYHVAPAAPHPAPRGDAENVDMPRGFAVAAVRLRDALAGGTTAPRPAPASTPDGAA